MEEPRCSSDQKYTFNPLSHGGGGAVRPPPVVFCPLLKKSSYNPYLKILDFSQLLVADTPMIFFQKFLFTSSDSTFGTFFAIYSKNLQATHT